MRHETVFRVTNSRYHADPSSNRVFFRRRCNDLTFQRITTAKRNVSPRPHFHADPAWLAIIRGFSSFAFASAGTITLADKFDRRSGRSR
jgi:hypothetical protein